MHPVLERPFLRFAPPRGLVLLLTALLVAGACQRSTPAPTNLLLITIDTLRADRLGAYGYRTARTPNLDGLAANGALFEQAIAQAPVTLPSHASILTGTYPPTHGVRDNVAYRVTEESLTLAEVLKEKGYDTAAFVGAYPLHRSFGLAQGFSVYDDQFGSQKDAPAGFFAERRASAVLDAARSWLREERSRPLFCWVHLFDPHVPYDPPQPGGGDPYDEEIAYVDAELGKLFTELKETGLLEKTLVVLTSDHGESLGEHGERTHGFYIYDATLRVPLLFHHPSLGAPRRIDAQVRTVDILPTVLELLGVTVPPAVEGKSLRPALQGESLALPAYAESYVPLVNFHWSPLRALRHEGWKYIEAPRPELYDLKRDPKETANLASAEAERAASLRQKLLSLEKSFSPPAGDKARRSPDEKTLETLATLGYLGGNLPEPSEGAALADPKDRIQIWDSMEEELVHLTSGRYREAIAILERVLKEDPTNLLALEHLGYARFQLGELAPARDAYQRLVELGPDRASGWASLGYCLEKLGQRERAMEHYRKAEELNPAYARGFLRMGYALLNGGKAEAAREQFEQVLALEPENDDARKGLARTYRLLGDLDKASSLYRSLLASEEDAEALAELAEALLSEGRQKEAEGFIAQALELSPREWKALYLRSMILNRSGETAAARRLLEEVVAVRPDFARAQHDLGVIYARDGDTPRAIAAYRRALALAPNALSHNGLGAIYARAQKWELAVSEFEKAIRIQADYATAYDNLAQAYRALGRPDKAEATLGRLAEVRNKAREK
jgi:choline-sulfatase